MSPKADQLLAAVFHGNPELALEALKQLTMFHEGVLNHTSTTEDTAILDLNTGYHQSLRLPSAQGLFEE